jgi:hypothetical protein
MVTHAARSTGTPRWADSITPAPLRDPDTVMRLERLGALHPSRLSFVRSLIRQMGREQWRIACQRFDIGADEAGEAVYTVDTPQGRYSFVVFAQVIDENDRTDRVIAEKWDYTFALTEGEPDATDMDRLRANVPKQEAGRVSARDLVLSRGNKSVRLFAYIVRELAAGRQPDVAEIAKVGYLMRTTAVYGNGKFGLADFGKLHADTPFRRPFAAQMLTVYLARLFSLDLVDHLARLRGGNSATGLTPRLRRAFGVGNATGLGMAPFITSHPALMDAWVSARETAIARVKGVPSASRIRTRTLANVFDRAITHADQWWTDDTAQHAAIVKLRAELRDIRRALFDADTPLIGQSYPWQRLCDWVRASFSLEAQELVHSLILEPYPDLVDDLEDRMAADCSHRVRAAMPLRELKHIVETTYAWAIGIDTADPVESHYFWYRAVEKEEPRLGERHSDPGADREMPIGVGHAVARLYQELRDLAPDALGESVGAFLMRRPEHRDLLARIQTLADKPYAEVRDNLLHRDMRPIALLRFKLSFFGAVRFDPKSDRWTRITLFSGTPLPEDFADPRLDCDASFATVWPETP